jgi:hypothetical protein
MNACDVDTRWTSGSADYETEFHTLKEELDGEWSTVYWDTAYARRFLCDERTQKIRKCEGDVQRAAQDLEILLLERSQGFNTNEQESLSCLFRLLSVNETLLAGHCVGVVDNIFRLWK